MQAFPTLFYDYVPDMAERRAPYRAEHLAHLGAEHDAGRIVMAGAVGNPPHGGILVFAENVDTAAIEAFVSADPYVKAGLVTAHRIEPWTVVTGA